MARKPTQQDRLRALTDICLALPEARREDKASHAAFLVGKKTFAYYLNNHHGDNLISVCCKVLPGENQFLVQSDPGRFYLPAYLGSKGVDCSAHGLGYAELERGQRIDSRKLHPNCTQAACRAAEAVRF